MQTRPLFTLATAALALLAGTADAQVRRITAVAQPPRQAAPPAGVAPGLPNPAGLPSPVPAGLAPPGSPNLSSPGAAAARLVLDGPLTETYLTVGGGGGGYAAAVAAAAGGTQVMGGAPFARGPLSAVDIARAFLEGDLNRDGSLSREEAQPLRLPAMFDDLDRNRDGLLSRFEYDDAFR